MSLFVDFRAKLINYKDLSAKYRKGVIEAIENGLIEETEIFDRVNT